MGAASSENFIGLVRKTKLAGKDAEKRQISHRYGDVSTYDVKSRRFLGLCSLT